MLAQLARADPKFTGPSQTPQRRSTGGYESDPGTGGAGGGTYSQTGELGTRARPDSRGAWLPACDPDPLRAEPMTELPPGLQEVLKPLFEMVEALPGKTQGVQTENGSRIAREKYPGNQTPGSR